MAIQEIQNYSHKNSFSLSTVTLKSACVVRKDQQIDAYSIYWIKEGTLTKGTYKYFCPFYKTPQYTLTVE